MTKLLVAKVVFDGEEHTIQTYADEKEAPKKVLKEIMPSDAQIVNCEWIDTLTEHRKAWNAENPNCKIPITS